MGSMPADLLALQRTVGNRQVQRMLARRTGNANQEQILLQIEEQPGIRPQTESAIETPSGASAQQKSGQPRFVAEEEIELPMAENAEAQADQIQPNDDAEKTLSENVETPVAQRPIIPQVDEEQQVVQRTALPMSCSRFNDGSPGITLTAGGVQRQGNQPQAPNAKRQDIIFIMGTDTKGNSFYSNAKKYFKTILPKADMQTKVRSLEGVFDYLRGHVSKQSPLGNLYLRFSCKCRGGLGFRLAEGNTENMTYGILKHALKEQANLFRTIEGIDEQTMIQIKGCNIGRDRRMMNLLDKAFGGSAKVVAPTHKQAYTSKAESLGAILSSSWQCEKIAC